MDIGYTQRKKKYDGMPILSCCICGLEKQREEFYWVKRSVRPSSWSSGCKECLKEVVRERTKRFPGASTRYYRKLRSENPDKVKEIGLKRLYGMSFSEYESLVTAQSGLCAICHRPPKKTLFVDHDHETDMVRGLLCMECNFAIGQFDEDTNRMASAIEYLKKWRSDGNPK